MQEDASALPAFPELGLLLWWQSTELLLPTQAQLSPGWSSPWVLGCAPMGGLPEPPCLNPAPEPKRMDAPTY